MRWMILALAISMAAPLYAEDEIQIKRHGGDELVDDVPDEAPAQKKKPGTENDVLNKLKLGSTAKPTEGKPAKDIAAPPANVPPKILDAESAYASVEFAIARGEFSSAADTLKGFVRNAAQEEVAKADKLCRDHYSRNIAQVITMCYMQINCVDCKATGVKACERCAGSGYTAAWVSWGNGGGPTPGTRKGSAATLGLKEVASGTQHRVVDVCPLCRGHGYEVCGRCLGTRLAGGQPSAYERSTYSDYLVTLANSILQKNEGDYANTGRQAPPSYAPREEAKMKPQIEQVWLRDSANQVKSDIQRLTRAEGYLMLALKVDPGLAVRSPMDIHDELSKIGFRRAGLFSELSERQQIYAQNRVERRLDEMAWADNYYTGTGPKTNGEHAKFQTVLGDE
jgi:hypothetical protein